MLTWKPSGRTKQKGTRPRQLPRVLVFLAVVSVSSLRVAVPVLAQTQGCEPIAARAGREFGCFVTAREELGKLPEFAPGSRGDWLASLCLRQHGNGHS